MLLEMTWLLRFEMTIDKAHKAFHWLFVRLKILNTDFNTVYQCLTLFY